MASEFIEKIRCHDLPAALKHVRQGDREAVGLILKRAETQALAPSPSMHVIRKKDGCAHIVVGDADKIELDMRFHQGRWWVYTVTF